MTIRPFRESDRETIKAITVEAFDGVSIDQNIERRYGLVAGHDWRFRKGRHIDEDVEAPGAAILVAEDDRGAIIGYIATQIDREAGVGLIPNMAVRAGLRGQGLGRKLIDAALTLFRDAGLELARIETLDQNPIGQHLYPDCGFVEVAKQIHFAMKL
jgi:ribosomal protein S18 acetylase RimI-like enzyme